MDKEFGSMTVASYNTSHTTESPEINIVYAVFISILSVQTVASNLLIIAAFYKIPSLQHKPGELLILNLACVDLLTGLVVLPVQSLVYIIPGYWPLGEIGCRLQALSLQTNIYASLFSILAISSDRCLLVLKDYPAYLKIQSPTRIRITITACWLVPCLPAIIEQILWNPAKSLDESASQINFNETCLTPPRRLRSYTMTVFFITYFGPVISVCILSIVFLYQLRRRLKATKVSPPGAAALRNGSPSPPATQANPKRQQPRSRYIKPAVSLIAIVLAMAICMLPYCFYVIIIELFFPESNNEKVLFGLLLLQFCNACFNPVLYGITQQKVRHFYGSFFTNRIVRPK